MDRRRCRDARLFTGDREIGFLTSAATSTRLGTVAMGYVHRDFVAPGTQIAAATASDRMPATVIAREHTRVVP